MQLFCLRHQHLKKETMKFILGQKLGMTRVFDQDGKMIPVTKVTVLPCAITQIKNTEKDGYTSVQISATKGEGKKIKNVMVSEFRVDEIDGYKTGDKVLADQFVAGDVVEVTGTSKGKGFAGVIKRHGFKRGPESHGGNNVREPGSIGAQQPQRVVLGRKMAGHMGVTTATIKNLRVIDVDKDVILISGAIPGPNKGLLKISGKSSVKTEVASEE